jgi:hypothetical protein
MEGQFHEDFRREEPAKTGADRPVGLVLAGFFGILALGPLLRGRALRPWALGVSVAFLVVALFAPRLLHPLNQLLTRLALLVSKVTNPLLTGMMFYLLFTPAAFLFRLFGKDPLKLKMDSEAESYWIPRHPPGPPPDTMRNQF